MKSRLTQLLIRGLTYGLLSLTTKLGLEMSSESVASIVLPIATGLMAAVCIVGDHVLHKVLAGDLASKLEAQVLAKLGLDGYEKK